MKKKLMVALVLSLVSTAAMAKDCEDDSIQSVSESGDVIIMESGAEYQVDAADQVDTRLWQTGDDVIVCDDDEIVNKDESGETASVSKIN